MAHVVNLMKIISVVIEPCFLRAAGSQARPRLARGVPAAGGTSLALLVSSVKGQIGLSTRASVGIAGNRLRRCRRAVLADASGQVSNGTT